MTYFHSTGDWRTINKKYEFLTLLIPPLRHIRKVKSILESISFTENMIFLKHKHMLYWGG